MVNGSMPGLASQTPAPAAAKETRQNHTHRGITSYSHSSKMSQSKTAYFGLKALKHHPELIPLAVALGTAVTGAFAYSTYALATKSDVRLVKSSELPPHERVDFTKPQKLLTINTEYKPIPELEALRKEIGSYKM